MAVRNQVIGTAIVNMKLSIGNSEPSRYHNTDNAAAKEPVTTVAS